MNFFWRSNLAILVLAFIVLAAGDLYSWRAVRNQAQKAGFDELAALARVARSHTPDVNDPSAVHHWIAEIATSGAQIALIRSDGRILAGTMPWRAIAKLTHSDLLAIADYLKSLPPVSNKVAGPFGPTETPTGLVMAVIPGNVYAALPKPPAPK